MLANGIKQSTSTTGAGPLTLSGTPAFSLAFGIGQPFCYGLLDSGGQMVEYGIGYLSDASTLVRARISATYNGTTYATSAPTAVALTGTTTVIGTPHAASLESMMPTVDGVSTGIRRFVTSAARNLSGASAGLSALRVYYVPFLLRVGAPVVSLGVAVTTAGAAGVVGRCGIYACNDKGYMGALLATTSDLDMSATGFVVGTLVSPLFLPPGWYYTAVVTSGTPSLDCYASNNNNLLGGNPLGMSTASTPVANDYRFESVASAVLPPSPSAVTSVNAVGVQHPPKIFVGVQ